MQIRDVMSQHAQTLTPQQSLGEAAEVMRRLDTGFVPVGQDDRLVGAITDRDIVVRGLADGKSADTRIGEIMSQEVLYCFDDQKVSEVAANMGERQVRRMPVVNREKRLVGVVSLGDLSTAGDPTAAGAALKDISQ